MKKRILEIQRLSARCDAFQKENKSLNRTIRVLNDKIKVIHEQHEYERQTIHKTVKQKLTTQFEREMAKADDKFKEEIAHLTKAWFVERNTGIRRDKVIYKLCKAIMNTEAILVDFTLKVRGNINDRLCLNDFWQTGFDISQKEILPKKKVVQRDELQAQITDLKAKNRYLEKEFNITKGLYEGLVDQWNEAMLKIKQLEKEKTILIKDYENKLTNLLMNNKEEVTNIKDEIMKEYSQFENCKKTLINELRLKDILLTRHQKYGEVLKTELVNAKNIIKDPNTLKKANRSLNFQNRILYPIKTAEDELGVSKSSERKKVFQSFDLFSNRSIKHSRSNSRCQSKARRFRNEINSYSKDRSLRKIYQKKREKVKTTSRTIISLYPHRLPTPDLNGSMDEVTSSDKLFRIKLN
ncbi:unnamed protein product [Moneuplotes crassus]|uniref:Uncharacterized protein n=1 Tax=Euplotes crassus TaxID=5936 RepID=A0AAD1UH40_EUPCR|nr:unnamed protein product [Moneuplotes crassus]